MTRFRRSKFSNNYGRSGSGNRNNVKSGLNYQNKTHTPTALFHPNSNTQKYTWPNRLIFFNLERLKKKGSHTQTNRHSQTDRHTAPHKNAPKRSHTTTTVLTGKMLTFALRPLRFLYPSKGYSKSSDVPLLHLILKKRRGIVGDSLQVC